MTPTQIIEEIASERLIEKILNNIDSDLSVDDKQDLSQELYIDLLQKDANKIITLYNENNLNYFIIKMIKNNIFSTTSPYYKKYGKWNANKSELTDEKIEKQNQY